MGTQTIEILDFVPGPAIDFSYFESPYWLVPGRGGGKAYALLREALSKSDRVGIGTFVMRHREHLAALRPAGPALMLTTMRFADELRPAGSLDLPETPRVNRRELELALRLVGSLATEWDPTRYRDTYRETLRAMIRDEVEAREISASPARRPAKVVNLMDALRRSLEQKKTVGPPRKRRATARHRAA